MVKENNSKDIWLKVLIGFIITIIVVGSTVAFSMINRLDSCKVEKDVFAESQKNQERQNAEIKDSLQRIEEKL